MKITQRQLRRIIKEELEMLSENQWDVGSATVAIADRFGGQPLNNLPKSGQRSERGKGGQTMFSIRNMVIFDDKSDRDIAWKALKAEGAALPPTDYLEPPINWQGIKLKQVNHHVGPEIYSAIGVSVLSKRDKV